ncbi:MAG: bifunctional precorrin-2 dehydrogenase/sirohydrochlorin ferrochelatase [Actinomycetota bacterium]
MNYFPVNLDLRNRPVLVVGAGRIALRKTQQLLACGAEVVVVAPEALDEFAGLPVTLELREFIPSDLDDCWLVVTATGVQPVDQAVFDEGEKRRVWVNSADDPDRCSFILPAVVRRGSLMMTTSTSGASPALSSFLRSRLGQCFGDGWADVVDDLATARAEVHARGESTEDVDWEPIIRSTLERRGLRVPCVVEGLDS